MPQEPSPLLRILIPAALVAVALGVAYAVYRNSAQAGGAQKPAPPAAAQAPAPGPGSPPAAAPAPPPPAPIPGLRAEVFDDPGPFEGIGSLDPGGAFMARVEFSHVGAGIGSLRLSRHYDTIERKPEEHTEVQSEHVRALAGSRPTLTPLAVLGLSVNGALVELSGLEVDPVAGPVTRPIWRQVAPGHFEAFVVDEDGRRVVRIERRYSLTPGSYDIALRQSAENLTDGPLSLRWYQLGPLDLPKDALTYGGDKRRLRFGYLPSAAINPGLRYVGADDFLWPRDSGKVNGPKDKARNRYPQEWPVWPNPTSRAEGYELAWVGMTNRYFGVAVHPLIDPADPAAGKALPLDPDEAVTRVLLDPLEPNLQNTVLGVRLRSPAVRVEPGGRMALDMGMYAGPLSRPVIRKEDTSASLLTAVGIDGIVVYNFGGPCGWCTFGWLTAALLWLLHLWHDWVLHDWALAIIVLVVCVRTVLHPVTKWSQIRLQRFGKQMQALAPKQKAIQEKYGHDRKKMQEEMGRLWKEEGINPAGALGCLPMFLQTPVWIALYAMLYFAVELRHQPAFFGVFQWMTGGRWWFLGDLAEPDRALLFGRDFNVPLVSGLMGPIHSLNVLPFILAIVFYAHQKYMSPPPSAAMTPEQIQQQRIMKWMTVIMFPVFMYNAPSGLAIYFIANSTLAIFESRYIRAHIDKYDLMNPKSGRGTGGFMKYLSEVADRQRQAVQNRFGQSRPMRPEGGKGGPRPGRPGPEPPPKRFKDR